MNKFFIPGFYLVLFFNKPTMVFLLWTVFHYTVIHCQNAEMMIAMLVSFEAKYLSASADHITSNFLKAVFRKFYFVHS